MTRPDPLPLAAAITAGGQSRRFGQDKALYRIGGVPLLDRVAGSLAACEPRLLVAPEGRYHRSGWAGRPDRRPGEGPLAGLETALGWLTELQPQGGWLAFAAVDLPNLTEAYWQRLAARRLAGAGAVVGLDAQGRLQPLAALYHSAALPAVTALLDAGERRMQTLLGQVPLIQVPWGELGAGAEVYINLNRPPTDLEG